MVEQPFLKSAIDEAQAMRDRLVSLGPSFALLDKEGMIEYLHTLYALVDKEHVIYTRLSLTDEAWAKEGLEALNDRRKEINLFQDVPLSQFFEMTKAQIKKYLYALEGDQPLWDDPLA